MISSTSSSTSKSPTPPSSRRNPVLTALDVIGGIALLSFGAVLGITVIVAATGFNAFTAACDAGPYAGITCNGGVLAAAVYGMIVVSVVAWFLGLGFFVVALIRKRIAFVWPLGAVLVTIAVLYLGAWIAGMTVPA